MNMLSAEVPVKVVRKIANTLRETSTWDDVFKKLMYERNSEAHRVVGRVEEKNKCEAWARKVSRMASLLVLIVLTGQELISIVYNDQPLGFLIGPFFLSVLLYLVYSGMVYTLVLIGTYWFFILRESGFPSLTNLIATGKVNSFFHALKLLLFILALLVAAWFIDGYQTIILILLLIIFWIIIVSIALEILPIRVVYIGVLSQDALTLIYRLQARLTPLRVVSYLSTGLAGAQAGICVESNYTFSTIEDLMEKIRDVRELPATVVIDTRYAELDNRFLKALRSSSQPYSPLILINDNKKDEMDKYPCHLRESDIKGTCVTENDLLDILKLDPWKIFKQPRSGVDGDGYA